jgi:hypothetical protein
VGVQDVMSMKKQKKIKLFDAKAVENMKLRWKVRRQVQQEILQKKLMDCYLRPSEQWDAYIERYPEAMQPMIKDFMRKADEQTRLHRT